LVQREQIEQYLQEDGIIVLDYALNAHHVHFTTHLQRSFVGTCTYQLRGHEERGSSSELRRLASMLAVRRVAWS
jgi:hypothetical protein